MAIDDQLAVLLAQNADLFAAYEEWSNGQIMLLAGTVDDPNSFNEEGGRTGALGYYPVVNVSGQTIYVPCLARLRALALGGENAEGFEELVAQVGGKLAAVDDAVAQAGTATTLATTKAGLADEKAALTAQKAAAAQNVVDAGAAILAAAQPVTGVVSRTAALEVAASASTVMAKTQAAPISSVLVFGRPVAPVTGSAISSPVFVFADPVSRSGYWNRVVGFNPQTTAGVVHLKVCDLVDTNFVQSGNDYDVTVPAGLFDIVVTIPVKQGQYVGFQAGGPAGSTTENRVAYTASTASDGAGYFNSGSTANVSSFAKGAAQTNIRIQLRAEIIYVTVTEDRLKASEVASAANATLASSTAASLSGVTKFGRQAAPVTGAQVSNNVFLYATPSAEARRITRVKGFNPQATAGVVHLKVFSLDAGTFNQIGSDVDVTVQAGAFDMALPAPIIVPAGAYRGFHPGGASSADTANSRIAFTSGTGDDGGYYQSSGGLNRTTFAQPALTTNVILQFGFTEERVIVTAQRVAFNSLLSRVRDRRAAAQVANPRTRPVTNPAPVVTFATAAPAGAVQFPPTITAASDYAPYVTVTGGWLIRNANYVYPSGTIRTIGASTGGTVGTSRATSHRAIFYTDAAAPLFRFNSNKTIPLRILVDGQFTSLAGYSNPVAGTDYWVTIDFGSRKPGGRRIEIELQGGEAGSGSNGYMQIGPFYVSPTDRIWSPERQDLGDRLMLFGDSYTFGPVASQDGTALLGDGLARVAADLLGIDNVHICGLSGSGWLARGSANTTPNILDRMTDLLGNPPDELAIMLGVNDAINAGQVVDGVTVSPATVQAQVVTALTQIRAAYPNLPIHVFGPWRSVGTVAIVQDYETAILAGAASLGDPLISTIPVVAPGWQTGTGRKGATAGDGNNDLYLAPDATHPTLDGYGYLGGRAANGIVAGREMIRGRLAL